MNALQTDDLFEEISLSTIEARRMFISRLFYKAFGGVVRYGPLKGFKLDDDPSWGTGDLAPKLFGLYEQEILQLLSDLRGQRRVLINLGAADGYYGIGLVSAGLFERSVCFEQSEKGRAVIAKTAQNNGVADKVTILGAAGADFPKVIAELGFKASDCLILCDVEGAEFSIFSGQCLDSLQGAHVIIELHGFLAVNGNVLESNLISHSRRLFVPSIVKTATRDLSSIPELDALRDSDRWLICSEGRPKLMSWLILVPK
jgi:hypothetical protein